MGKVAIVVTLVGFVGLVIGLIGTVAFANSKQFVAATLFCSSETDPNCDEASSTVIDADGAVCQVGNLGLYKSDYTPGCAVGTTYELNDVLLPIADADTLEFGILFPAQTNFAGLGEALGFPEEFEGCEEYFSDASIVTGVTGIAVGQNTSGLDDFRDGVKAQFDAGLVGVEFQLDQTVNTFGALAEASLIEFGLNSSDIEAADPAFGGATWLVALPAVVIPGLAEPQKTALQNLYDLVDGINTASGGCVSTAACLDLAVFLGTPDWGASGANVATASETGLGPQGFYSRYDGAACTALGGCTYYEYLQSVIIPALADDPDTAGLLTLVLGAVDDYFLAVKPVIDALPTFPTYTDLTVAEVEAAAFLVQQGTAGPEDAALISNFFATATFIANTANSFRQVDAIPKFLDTPAALQTPAFAILCGVLGISTSCNFIDIIDASVAADDGLDANVTQGLLDVQAFATGCVDAGQPDFDICLLDVAGAGLIGGLYDATDGISLAAQLENATAQCEDDELDAAAIATAQGLIPIGIGLNGAGLAIAIVALIMYALGKNMKVAKIIMLLGGVVSIVGLAMAVAALLGVATAPIYASVGGDGGDQEEGDQVFSNSDGYTYILTGIVANLLGGLLLLGGACCLPTEESSDVLAAK